MTTTIQDVSVVSAHDQAVKLIAHEWRKLADYRITTYTGARKFQWPRSIRNYPDIVGWRPNPTGNRLHLVGEVETKESLARPDARHRWRDYAKLGVPFYLFVPKGSRDAAETAAMKAGVLFSGIYEYAVLNEACLISRG